MLLTRHHKIFGAQLQLRCVINRRPY